MLKATLRGILAHKLRLSLAGFAVVLGVAFIAGTLILGDTINSTFENLFASTTAGVDAQVRGVSTGKVEGQAIHPPVPAAEITTVRGVDGVSEAFGEVLRSVPIVGADGKVVATGGAPSLGVLWNPYSDMSAFRLRAGTAPQGPSQVVVDAHTASGQRFTVGQTIRVVLPNGGPRAFTLAGITGFGNEDNLAGATVVAFDPQAGPALLGSPSEVDAIDVKARSGVSGSDLLHRLGAVLPSGLEAVSGQTVAQEQTDQIETAIGFLTTFLLVFGFIALFVGSFIILNTFSILIAQRTRELALLRCLGASRAQVMQSVVVEALITGVVASVIGLGAGVAIAKGLEALLGAVGLDLSGSSLQFEPRTAIAGMLVGTVVTVVASIVPARRATRIAPVEALRDAEPPVSAVTVRRVATGGGILVAGVAVMLVGLFALSSNQLLATGLGALATFIGVAVLAPIIVVPVVSAIGVPIRRLRGVPGQLARDNAMRQPRRTASTASALMIGVGLVSCFTVVAASLTDSINRIIDRSVNADYIVSPRTQGQTGMSPDVAGRVAADSAVAVASPITSTFFHTGSDTLQAEGVDPATILSVVDIPVNAGAALSSLRDGDVAISEDAARNRGLGLGDSLSMQFDRPGAHVQRVTAIYQRNPLLGDYLLTRSLTQATGIQVDDVVLLVRGRTGVSQTDLRSAVDKDVQDFPDVQVQNNAEYKDSSAKQIGVLLNLLTALVFLAILIALLGVVNTMALSILERVRELGLVRALGMTRSQTRTMVRWETVLITVFGALLGCVVGIFFGIALVRAFASQGVDVLSLGLGQQIGYVVVAFVAGLVAAIWPARRAARVDMLRAIVTE
ncbi:MAG TPA: FtsX-like permease family protein [Candidatus Dormibacteraeota bacterium]|nr:FtsX-like permease family protein [Candidatus Dormibacteraeota bacterium]